MSAGFKLLTVPLVLFLIISCFPEKRPTITESEAEPENIAATTADKGLSLSEYIALPVWEDVGDSLFALYAAAEGSDTGAMQQLLSAVAGNFQLASKEFASLDLGPEAVELNPLIQSACDSYGAACEAFAESGLPSDLITMNKADQDLQGFLDLLQEKSPAEYESILSTLSSPYDLETSAVSIGTTLYNKSRDLVLFSDELDEREDAFEICSAIVEQAAETGSLAELEEELEAQVEEGTPSPAVLFTLSAIYGRKGMKREAYEMLVQVEEEVKKRPKVVFNLAMVHGRKDQLKTELDAEEIKFRTPDGFVPVTGGRFRFGADVGFGVEGPDRYVVVGDFFIMKEEVSFAQYDAFCEATGREKPDDQGWGRGEQPAVNVTWYEALAYCNWLSEQMGFEPSYIIQGRRVTCDFDADGFRLPTEAEWEYAARGGSISENLSFSGSSNPDESGWYMDNSGGQPHPGGELTANELGIYDMSGNVWEWCWDWYAEYKGTLQVNPAGPASGELKTLRGGSWSYFEEDMAVSSRGRVYPDDRDANNGFRLVQSIR